MDITEMDNGYILDSNNLLNLERVYEKDKIKQLKGMCCIFSIVFITVRPLVSVVFGRTKFWSQKPQITEDHG